MRKKLLYVSIAVILMAMSCAKTDKSVTIEIINDQAFDRSNETVELKLSDLQVFDTGDYSNLSVTDIKSGSTLLSQLIDSTSDGIADAIIFQTEVKANSLKQYKIAMKTGDTNPPGDSLRTYARFVPERFDDFAWENDRVAFRVYGPAIQKMAEEGSKGGTLSSGIDCWLKRVNYPILDKWYLKNTDGTGSYHADTGEGLDNYHVGPSRGCGGTGVWDRGKLISSKNYIAYKVVANGPVKSIFELQYANWFAGNKTIKEHKILSIELGNNLTKHVVKTEGSDSLAIGIALHDNLGEISFDTSAGWFSYWTKHDSSELGTAIVVDPRYYIAHTKTNSKIPDEKHLLLHLKVIDHQVEYYSGFGWLKSRQFKNKTEWEYYLAQFARQHKSPLKVKVVANTP